MKKARDEEGKRGIEKYRNDEDGKVVVQASTAPREGR